MTRLCSLLGLTFLLAPHSHAQPAAALTEEKEIIVEGKAQDLVGKATSATVGQASSEELMARPILRRSEVLEVIPGLITTQHAGGGKATQYFLRGFNLDHGTDFATSLEGMPLNLKTHAHGQGYTDLNGILPELLDGVDYTKGVYTAANGDLSAAGSANFRLKNRLEQDMISAEWGEYGYWRGLVAGSIDLHKSASSAATRGKSAKNVSPVASTEINALTYALEHNSYDGPWLLSENFSRWNGMLRWFTGDNANHFSLTAMGYSGDWRSSDQIPQRAIVRGLVDRFGSLDPTTGGQSQRYSLNAAWKMTKGDVITERNIFLAYYDLDLYSNFTYFLDDPINGDQFNQRESRWVVGGNLQRSWTERHFLGHEASYTAGYQSRHDIIDDIGLYKTRRTDRLSTVREDDVWQSNNSLYGEATVKWAPRFRTIAGLRGDLFRFKTQRSSLKDNEGEEWAGIVSPKLSAVFGPWANTELYLNYGMGFHSNDARGVNTRVDPTTGSSVPTVDPLVRIHGAEVGLRSNLSSTLTTTLAYFWQQSDSELVYVGDAGTNEPGPGSQRHGIELATYWRPTEWLALDAELAITDAQFRDAGAADQIPNSIPWMFSGGLTFGAKAGENGFFGGLRVRAFDRRPLTEDGSQEGISSFLMNASVGYRHNNWETAVECLNLLDRANNDIEYYYGSRLQGEPAEGREDKHLHPTEPRMFRVRVTYRF